MKFWERVHIVMEKLPSRDHDFLTKIRFLVNFLILDRNRPFKNSKEKEKKSEKISLSL